jgi:cytochrome P450
VRAGVLINRIVAGETVSSAIAASFVYLSQNPDYYQQLCSEIRTSFTIGEEIVGGIRLNNCRYLRACINEALRLSPPVPCTLWREALHNAPGKLVVDGHVIPIGTQVGVNTYSIHHSPEYFPEPYDYQPNRWLRGNEKALANPDAFVPFSIGTRGCAGKSSKLLHAQTESLSTYLLFSCLIE